MIPTKLQARTTSPGLPKRDPGHVQEIQRARLLAGAGEACIRLGAPAVTVSDIVACAGVSRRTFYELFANREECLLAALEDALERAAAVVLPAYRAPASWEERIHAGLLALTSLIDAQPAVGRLLIVESLAAGHLAAQRRSEVVSKIAAVIDQDGREAGPEHEAGRGCDPPSLAGQAAVGAVLSVLHARVSREGEDSLTRLVPDLSGILVLPYLGPSAARSQLARRPARTRRPPRAADEPLTGLPVRLTYRTMRVLLAIGQHPLASNREIGGEAGIQDQGQISKLLARLERAGLVLNHRPQRDAGEPNAWKLTPQGSRVHDAISTRLAGV